jgi:hypothetical protein
MLGAWNLIQCIQKMEDIKALKKQSAVIIARYIRCVQARNNAWTCKENLLKRQNLDPVNECTLIGVPLSELEYIYQYPISTSSKTYHIHDIRELMQILKKNYATAKCPYTNQPFTRYQKYHIVRHYYHNRELSLEFKDLVMERLSHRDYVQCVESVNVLMDPYSNFNIDQVKDVHLLNLLTEIVKFESVTDDASYMAQAHYHYIHGNIRTFRGCAMMFITKLFEHHSDQSGLALRLALRVKYCQQIFDFTADPIVIYRLPPMDPGLIADLQDAGLIPVTPLPPTPVPAIEPSLAPAERHHRGRVWSVSDEGRPSQRRRTTSSNEGGN